MPVRQEIRFCTATDGVQIAMGLYGAGPPIVKAPNWLTHIERDPSSMLNRHWVEELSRRHRFVTYDGRGCGLSSADVGEISFESWVRDLETVVDSLELDTFPLMGDSQGAAVAIAFAARHPKRVSRLVLFGPFATSYFTTGNPDPRIIEEAEALLKAMELGWGRGAPAFRQVFVSKFMPNASAEEQRDFDEYQRATATPENAVRSMRAMFSIDVKEEARRVSCPTLIFHSRGDQLIRFEQGRKVAGLIPGASFVPLDCVNHIPSAGEACWPDIVRELREFLGDGAEGATPPHLTARQLEVLAHMASGRTDKQIARALNLSPRTIEMHVAGVLRAMECATRTEAVHRAGAAGLIAR